MAQTPEVSQSINSLSFAEEPWLDQILPPPFVITEGWLTEINTAIQIGSTALSLHSPTRHFAEVAVARKKFRHLLGVHEEDSPIGKAYLKSEKSMDKDVSGDNLPKHRPSIILGTFKALHDVAGDIVGTANQVPNLLNISAPTIHKNATHLDRLMRFFEWHGDFAALLREAPAIMTFSTSRYNLAARLAREHGKPEDKGIGSSRIKSLLSTCMEAQLLALIKNKSYSLGQSTNTKQAVSVVRESLYIELKSSSAAAKIGGRLLGEYFRYRPPAKSAFTRHPHLSEYISIETPKDFVRGDEAWLPIVKADKKRLGVKGLQELNEIIRLGSARMRDLRTSQAKMVVEARYHFFYLLGWTDPNCPFYQSYQQLVQRNSQLIPLDKCVDMLNILTRAGVDLDIMLRRYAEIFYYSATSVEARIQLIYDGGYDLTKALWKRPTLLLLKIDSLQTWLERNFGPPKSL